MLLTDQKKKQKILRMSHLEWPKVKWPFLPQNESEKIHFLRKFPEFCCVLLPHPRITDGKHCCNRLTCQSVCQFVSNLTCGKKTHIFSPKNLFDSFSATDTRHKMFHASLQVLCSVWKRMERKWRKKWKYNRIDIWLNFQEERGKKGRFDLIFCQTNHIFRGRWTRVKDHKKLDLELNQRETKATFDCCVEHSLSLSSFSMIISASSLFFGTAVDEFRTWHPRHLSSHSNNFEQFSLEPDHSLWFTDNVPSS